MTPLKVLRVAFADAAIQSSDKFKIYMGPHVNDYLPLSLSVRPTQVAWGGTLVGGYGRTTERPLQLR